MTANRHDRETLHEMEQRLEELEEGIERARREAEEHGHLGGKDEPTLADPDPSGTQTDGADADR